MEHLATHPAVQQALADGRLAIHGWVYEIETGAVRAYDPARGTFVPFPEI
ncbi:MAG: carbonic anhydrase [Pseudomonadota bacterium]